MTPAPQTARYELLCKALEELIADPRTSKRVRLTAIQRLDDLLKRQERKEATEARRKEREALRAAKRAEQASQQHVEQSRAVDEEAEQMRRVQKFLDGIAQKKIESQKS